MKRSATAIEAGAHRQVRMYPSSCVGLDCVGPGGHTVRRHQRCLEESAGDRRRSTGRSNRQQDTAEHSLQAEGASEIVEVRHAWRRRCVGTCADDARRAGTAMLRRPEVTEKVVMLELARDQEQGVEGYAEEGAAISRSASHLVDDVTGR
jgi:hypothetical protein